MKHVESIEDLLFSVARKGDPSAFYALFEDSIDALVREMLQKHELNDACERVCEGVSAIYTRFFQDSIRQSVELWFDQQLLQEFGFSVETRDHTVTEAHKSDESLRKSKKLKNCANKKLKDIPPQGEAIGDMSNPKAEEGTNLSGDNSDKVPHKNQVTKTESDPVVICKEKMMGALQRKYHALFSKRSAGKRFVDSLYHNKKIFLFGIPAAVLIFVAGYFVLLQTKVTVSFQIRSSEKPFTFSVPFSSEDTTMFADTAVVIEAVSDSADTNFSDYTDTVEAKPASVNKPQASKKKMSVRKISSSVQQSRKRKTVQSKPSAPEPKIASVPKPKPKPAVSKSVSNDTTDSVVNRKTSSAAASRPENKQESPGSTLVSNESSVTGSLEKDTVSAEAAGQKRDAGLSEPLHSNSQPGGSQPSTGEDSSNTSAEPAQYKDVNDGGGSGDIDNPADKEPLFE